MHPLRELLDKDCHVCSADLVPETALTAIVRYALVPLPGEETTWSTGSIVLLCTNCARAEQEQQEERRCNGTVFQD